MLYLILISYIIFAGLFFTEWLSFFIDDKEMSPPIRLFSGILLVIATILWPLIVPLAYLELLKFNRKHKKIISLLLNLPDIKVLDDAYLRKKVSESLSLSISASSIKSEDN